MSETSKDPVWDRIRRETEKHASDEPILASFLHATILNHARLESALSFHLANQLDSPTASSLLLREVMLEAMDSDSSIREAMRADFANDALAVGTPETGFQVLMGYDPIDGDIPVPGTGGGLPIDLALSDGDDFFWASGTTATGPDGLWRWQDGGSITLRARCCRP